MTYPSSHVPAGGGVYNPVAGVQAVYGRNALSQMNSLTVGGQSVITSACYKDLQSLLTTRGASSWLVDTATNRLHSSTGATYDANGNLTGLSGGGNFTYDTANRVTTANLTGEKYRYTTDNRRVYKYRPGWGEEITFWGPTGRLATYRMTCAHCSLRDQFERGPRTRWPGFRLLRRLTVRGESA